MAEKLDGVIIDNIEYEFQYSGSSVGDLPISKRDEIQDIESFAFCSNDETEKYVEISTDGVKSKGYFDLEGNSVFSNSSDYDFLKLIFNKWMCIGDSTTHGFVCDYPHGVTYHPMTVSTPRFLSQLTGMTVINAGHGSWNCKEWWANLAKDENIPYSSIDLVTIEMGYNRGFTDTLDTDVTPYSNYEEYLETDTGCYCKIIEYILEKNPNIFIVLVISPKIPITDTSAIVIQKIATKYSLPIINLGQTDIINLNDDKLHGYYSSSATTKDYVHFNALGYLYKAHLLWYYMQKVILSNFEQVKNKATRRWITSGSSSGGYNNNKIIIEDMTTNSNR